MHCFNLAGYIGLKVQDVVRHLRLSSGQLKETKLDADHFVAIGVDREVLVELRDELATALPNRFEVLHANRRGQPLILAIC